MRRSNLLLISLALLAVLATAAAISLGVPLAACPSCSGAGKLTVMESHPEAMGSGSSLGKLIDVECSTCAGRARVTLYHRWRGEQPDPSGK
ncbi:MAG: hypothetical protein HY293_11680 [Planctomycetes bacterium]|nr:hypothetical protein [Planctomycetota bacterium]